MEIKSEDEEKDWNELYFFVWGNQMKIFVLETWCKLFSIDLFCKDAKFTKSIFCGQLVSCKREIIVSKNILSTSDIWDFWVKDSPTLENENPERKTMFCKKDGLTSRFHFYEITIMQWKPNLRLYSSDWNLVLHSWVNLNWGVHLQRNFIYSNMVPLRQMS